MSTSEPPETRAVGMRVELCGTHQAARLAIFAELTFRETFGASNTPDDMRLHCEAHYGEAIQARELADPTMTTFIVEHDDALIACLQLRQHAGKPNELEIQRVYVDSAWHGAGIAPMLIRTALDTARRAGATHVWLGVWEHNPRAIAFYRKHGFVDSGEHTFMLGTDRQRDVIMSRPLDEPATDMIGER